MSTKNTRVNLMAAALVALALVLGSLVGYFAFGGQPTPTEAVVPATETTCSMCTTSLGGSAGGGGGNVGLAPPTTNDALMGGGVGGSGGSGGTGVPR